MSSNRLQMLKQRDRTLPIKWFDLVTFDKEWLKDKTMGSYEELQPDGSTVVKPIVFDKDGNKVYP